MLASGGVEWGGFGYGGYFECGRVGSAGGEGGFVEVVSAPGCFDEF